MLASTTAQTARKEADAAIEVATGERDEALSEIVRLEDQLNDYQNNLAIQKSHENIKDLQAHLTQPDSDNAVLMTRIEERNSQIAGLKDKLKVARDDNKQLQPELIEIARNN